MSSTPCAAVAAAGGVRVACAHFGRCRPAVIPARHVDPPPTTNHPPTIGTCPSPNSGIMSPINTQGGKHGKAASPTSRRQLATMTGGWRDPTNATTGSVPRPTGASSRVKGPAPVMSATSTAGRKFHQGEVTNFNLRFASASIVCVCLRALRFRRVNQCLSVLRCTDPPPTPQLDDAIVNATDDTADVHANAWATIRGNGERP